MGDEDRRKIDLGNAAVVAIISGFILMVLSVPFSSLFMIELGGAISIVGIVMILMESKKKKNDHIANRNLFQEEYDEYIEKLGVVESDTQVTMFQMSDYNFEVKIPQYLWISDGVINIFPKAEYYKNQKTSSISKPDVSELKLKSIPIDSIMYFEEVGELRKYAVVSGGGTSLKGALLGYAVADEAGAIIGSRAPVKTTIVSDDDRRVELLYKSNDNNVENLEFTHEAYRVLKSLIPSKELRRIVNIKQSEQCG